MLAHGLFLISAPTASASLNKVSIIKRGPNWQPPLSCTEPRDAPGGPGKRRFGQ